MGSVNILCIKRRVNLSQVPSSLLPSFPFSSIFLSCVWKASWYFRRDLYFWSGSKKAWFYENAKIKFEVPSFLIEVLGILLNTDLINMKSALYRKIVLTWKYFLPFSRVISKVEIIKNKHTSFPNLNFVAAKWNTNLRLSELCSIV